MDLLLQSDQLIIYFRKAIMKLSQQQKNVIEKIRTGVVYFKTDGNRGDIKQSTILSLIKNHIITAKYNGRECPEPSKASPRYVPQAYCWTDAEIVDWKYKN